MSDEKRAANRAQFPKTAVIVDEFREVFGPGVKLLWAEESGQVIGRRHEEEVPAAHEQR